ncbi:biotin transporter BioY [Bacillus aerolatus]|uniref:Biotin transporter n=1 Tax=Bacillus aerolatus TaxID=2653354 RepID=A0A6I1FJ67_9BACI|nr:biotin transporter BioY [Bacillus aerolatus]KAB7705974.1 biotin transporter BioY [Bacillus aerolatus]
MKTKDITYVALFAAVMGALGMIPPIPLSFTPVPITLQTLGVVLAGGILGARLGFLSQMTFLLLVAAGLPLLSGGRGGIGVFVGPSAGYLFSYPIAAALLGFILSRFRTLTLKKVLFVNLTAGVFTLYLFGIPVQAFIMDLPLVHTIKISLIYIPGDLIKATVASYLVYKLRKSTVVSRQFVKAS